MDDDRWKNLEIWKKADELALKVYLISKTFPKEEVYGITSQIRRAALSIPTNIVEGYSRKGDKELARFISISLGSLAEVKYLIHFCEQLNFFKDSNILDIIKGYEELGKMLWTFYQKIQ